MVDSIQVQLQQIRSRIQNFDWETNPEWEMDLYEIKASIKKYWHDHKS